MSTHRSARNRAVLLAALAVLALAGCGGDDDPTAPGGGAGGPAVLVLGDGGTEEHVMAVLRGAGCDVRDGGLFHEFTGDGLGWADAVVLLAGVDYDHDMDDRGETALAAFVAGGGGLLTTEWLSFSIERQDYHQIIQTVVPVTYAGSYAAGSETYTVLADHPITAGLPASFSTGGDSQYSVVGPKSGALQVIRGSRSGHAVVTWNAGGRVVAWNMAGSYGGGDVFNADLDRLLTNIVGFVAKAAADDVAVGTVSMEASYLRIRNDGDGAAGDTTNPGDYYVSVRMRDLTGDEPVVLGFVDSHLVQGVDGQSPNVDQRVISAVPLTDGRRIEARVSFLENDPGRPHASIGTAVTFTYRADAGCWERTGGAPCVPSGSMESGTLTLRDFSGSPLDTDLIWIFRAHR